MSILGASTILDASSSGAGSKPAALPFRPIRRVAAHRQHWADSSPTTAPRSCARARRGRRHRQRSKYCKRNWRIGVTRLDGGRRSRSPASMTQTLSIALPTFNCTHSPTCFRLLHSRLSSIHSGAAFAARAIWTPRCDWSKPSATSIERQWAMGYAAIRRRHCRAPAVAAPANASMIRAPL